jgi:uncharacterized repeat protein (TIGR01451 family)
MSTFNIWRKTRVLHLGLALACGLTLLLGLMLAMGAADTSEAGLAQGSTIRYVAPAPTGYDSGNSCMEVDNPCATIQHAVDIADAGDEIRVASGTYTATGSNVVTITKSITIIGGFEPPDWTTSVSSSTTRIDGERARRGIEVKHGVNATIAYLMVTRGRYGMGGGLFLRSASWVDISNSKIEDNESLSTYLLDGGGGLQAWGDVTLRNTEIISNFAKKWGGGLDIYGRATLIETKVLSNTVRGMGGGLYSRGQVTVTNSVFKYNATLIPSPSPRGGGGMWVQGHIVLSGTQVMSNTTVQDGGGLYLKDGVLTMTNAIIAGNHADRAGSGLYITGSPSCKLVHTTVARNLGDAGSGIHITGTSSTVAMTNTILVSHTVGITCTAGNTVTLNGVLWYSNTINYNGECTITVTNEYTGNPAFVADGYHLAASSEAIDKGVNAGVDDDIDGDPRPAGTGYDIGADEYYHPALDVTKQADPDPVLSGTPLTYTIRVTNTGNVTLTAIITDILPRHVTPRGVLTRTAVISVPNGVWTETVVVTAKIGYSGTLTNVVQVTTVEGAMGVYTETSTAVVTPALVVTKRADPDPAQPGSPLTYTIRVTNTGNVTLTATITDTLPRWVTPTGTLTWTAVIPAPGGVWTETVVVTAELGSCGLINRVEVTTDEGATGDYTEISAVDAHCFYLPIIFRNYDPRLVEVSGTLHAGDVCVFCCFPVTLETTSEIYELFAFGWHEYDGLYVKVRGLLQGPCEWNLRKVISVISIEVLDPPP